jgi:hypothetical protein
MNKEELEQALSLIDEEIMVMDGFEEAFIGLSLRCGQPTLASYSWEKMVYILMDRDGMEYDEAVEYISYNCLGAWMGELTPSIVLPLEF